jgi:hypothetical protein
MPTGNPRSSSAPARPRIPQPHRGELVKGRLVRDGRRHRLGRPPGPALDVGEDMAELCLRAEPTPALLLSAEGEEATLTVGGEAQRPASLLASGSDHLTGCLARHRRRPLSNEGGAHLSSPPARALCASGGRCSSRGLGSRRPPALRRDGAVVRPRRGRRGRSRAHPCERRRGAYRRRDSSSRSAALDLEELRLRPSGAAASRASSRLNRG